jgi:hypothetical protein
MSASIILDVDTYESEKLRLLPTEKAGAFSTVFMVVFASPLLLCVSVGLLVVDWWTGRTGQILTDELLVFACVMVFLVALTFIYLVRSVAQLDRKRFHRTRWLLVIAAVLAFGVPIAASIGDTHDPGQGALLYFWYFGWLFYVMGVLYVSHWWSVLELLLIPLVSAFAWGKQRQTTYKQMWALDEEVRRLLRDDPDRGFYSGRILRSAFGVPRIVDFVPHGQAWLVFLFIIGSFCYGLQLTSFFVYVGAVMYPLVLALAQCPDFSTMLACADPIFSDQALTSWLIIGLGFIPLVIVAPYLGALFFTLAQSKIRFSITERTKSDLRKPVLFLRAFKDDQVKLRQARLGWGARIGRWLENIGDLDRMLLEEATPYGPVVAIGKQDDAWPPYGAARGYFDDKTWQSAVLDLAERSMAIVLCVDETEGIWWEVEHVAARYPDKTLVLVHPSKRARDANIRIVNGLATIMERAVPTLKDFSAGVARNAAERLAILGFYIDEKGALNIARSSTFSRIAFLIMVRFFLRKKWGLAR